jgi:hypothetical protein
MNDKELPEGWTRSISVPGCALGPGGFVVSRTTLARILATGPDLLARWDELMGGDA